MYSRRGRLGIGGVANLGPLNCAPTACAFSSSMLGCYIGSDVSKVTDTLLKYIWIKMPPIGPTHYQYEGLNGITLVVVRTQYIPQRARRSGTKYAPSNPYSNRTG